MSAKEQKVLSLAVSRSRAKPEIGLIQPYRTEILLAHFFLSFSAFCYALIIPNTINVAGAQPIILTLTLALGTVILSGRFFDHRATALVAAFLLLQVLGISGLLGVFSHFPIAVFGCVFILSVNSYTTKTKSIVASLLLGAATAGITCIFDVALVLPCILASALSLFFVTSNSIGKGFSALPIAGVILAESHLPSVHANEPLLGSLAISLMTFSFVAFAPAIISKTKIENAIIASFLSCSTLYTLTTLCLVKFAPEMGVQHSLNFASGIIFGAAFSLNLKLREQTKTFYGIWLLCFLLLVPAIFTDSVVNIAILHPTLFICGLGFTSPLCLISWFNSVNSKKVRPCQITNITFLGVISGSIGVGLLIANHLLG